MITTAQGPPTNLTRTRRVVWVAPNAGGAWSTSGTASSFSVAPGAAAMRLATAGMQLSGYPGSVARTDADVTMTFGSDRVPTGGPVYITVNGRRVAANSGYNARMLLTVSGSVTLWLTRMVNGTETALGAKMTVPGLTYSAGTPIRVRVQVTGTNPAVLRARVWSAAGVEPTTWQAGATDSTAALQINGSVGFTAYLSSAATNAPVTVRLTDLSARPTTAA